MCSGCHPPALQRRWLKPCLLFVFFNEMVTFCLKLSWARFRPVCVSSWRWARSPGHGQTPFVSCLHVSVPKFRAQRVYVLDMGLHHHHKQFSSCIFAARVCSISPLGLCLQRSSGSLQVKVGWGLELPGLVGRCPCPWQRTGLNGVLRSLPTQIIQ